MESVRRSLRLGLLLTSAWCVLTMASPTGLEAQRGEAYGPAVQPYISEDAPLIALVGVNLVDGTGAPARADQTILIRDGRIEAVGARASVAIPAGAKVHTLSGHTVIPGLIGMHNHTFYTTQGRSVQLNYSSPRLYLGSGVTTIRTTGAASPYSELNMMREIDALQQPGPRMHVTGPYITGAGAGGHMLAVTSPEQARRVVGYWADEGATWFKAYTLITREDLGAAIEEAHRRGLKFTGHLCSVSFREAVALGIDNIEHGLFTNSDYDPLKEPDACPPGMMGRLASLDVDGEAVRTTIREMVDNDVSMTSTLAVYELSFPGRPPLEERFARAMAPEAYAEYMATRARIAENANTSTMPDVFRNAQAFEIAFVRSGGLLAAGVDPTGNGGALPGFGDQRNYELLLEAGFGAEESIQIMTLNGARILGNDDQLGSVEPGKIADLVVIAGDPVRNPAQIRQVVTVFKDGIGYNAEALVRAVDGLVGIR
jgi:imidazolonepropionase-like amidohydrolase